MVVYSNNGYARVIGTDYLSLTRALGAEYNAYLTIMASGSWAVSKTATRRCSNLCIKCMSTASLTRNI